MISNKISIRASHIIYSLIRKGFEIEISFKHMLFFLLFFIKQSSFQLFKKKQKQFDFQVQNKFKIIKFGFIFEIIFVQRIFLSTSKEVYFTQFLNYECLKFKCNVFKKCKFLFTKKQNEVIILYVFFMYKIIDILLFFVYQCMIE